ncbi:hypothetical protein [Vagococcus intermedius]|uniref:Uncharacterized protein n=1 Tax=Vagococcus intermedius TaxID=2991418 RepID=A0AAF0I8H7_9ENTE|nr:hypothetical protein [Vagococcus intermedius]WEG74400.1 hypothetical protein OL234_10580 [Vagococcus intermedius]WEG76521.1 hypothetical protein OL235_10755 [Vagococcus intermedius]
MVNLYNGKHDKGITAKEASNHWYLSLDSTYPNGDKRVRSTRLMRSARLIEMNEEATPKEIDRYKFIYLGYGVFGSKGFLDEVELIIRQIKRNQ